MASASAGDIMTYLEQNGLTKTAAAGVVGNLQQESSLNPAAAGGGLAQWQAPRGPTDTSLGGQLSYLVTDLRTNYTGLLAQLNAATTPGQAATLFSNQYERPGNPQLQNRINYANAAYTGGGGGNALSNIEQFLQGTTGIPVPTIAGEAKAATDSPGAIGQVATQVGGIGSSIGDFFGKITSGAFWLRVLEVLAGVALLAMGLMSLSGRTTTPVTVAKGAARNATKAAVLA